MAVPCTYYQNQTLDVYTFGSLNMYSGCILDMKWSQWSSEDIVTKVREAMSTGSGILKCIRAEWDIQLLAGCKVEQNQTTVLCTKRNKVSTRGHSALITIIGPVLWWKPADSAALCTRAAPPHPFIGKEVRA